MKRLFPRTGITAANTAIVLLATGGAVTAKQVSIACKGVDVRVAAANRETASRVCENVREDLQTLANCHLIQSSPIEISIVPELSHPLGDGCVAIADCQLNKLEITDPDLMQGVIAANEIYRRIPVSLLFDSLVTHELTHLLVGQSNRLQGKATDHEYMAYAMQMDRLPDEWRQLFLDEIPNPESVERERINSFMLVFDPNKFAAYTWLHFSKPNNGCSQFKRLLDGEDTFHYDLE